MEKRPDIDIRSLTRDDVGVYWPLRLRALREEPQAFGSSYEEASQRSLQDAAERLPAKAGMDDNFVLMAFSSEGDPAGIVGLLRDHLGKMGHKAMIWGVYVVPEWRGKGVARTLMREAIERARRAPGLLQIYLSVVTTNPAAVALYESLGFRITGTEPRALLVEGTFYDEHFMVLMLDRLAEEEALPSGS